MKLKKYKLLAKKWKGSHRFQSCLIFDNGEKKLEENFLYCPDGYYVRKSFDEIQILNNLNYFGDFSLFKTAFCIFKSLNKHGH